MAFTGLENKSGLGDWCYTVVHMAVNLIKIMLFIGGAALAAGSILGKDPQPSQPVPVAAAQHQQPGIIFWHAQDRDQATFLQGLIDEFNQARSQPVTLETGMELEQSLLTQVETGSAPPVALAPFDIVSLHRQLQLSPIPADFLAKNFRPGDLKSVTIDGKIYGLPILGGNHLVLYYNKKYVAEPATSFAVLAKQTVALKQSHPEVQPLAMFYDNAYSFLAVFLSKRLAHNKGQSPLNLLDFDHPACAEALATYKGWSEQGLIPATCDYDCPTTDFFAGKFAYAINGDWAFKETRRRLGKNFGVAELPQVDGEPFISARGGQALVFPGQSLAGPNKAALAALAKFLTTRDTQKRWWRQGQRIPALPAVLSELRPDDPQAVMAPLFAAYERTEPLAPSAQLAYMWPAVRKGLQLYLNGVRRSSAACQYMRQLMERHHQERAK